MVSKIFATTKSDDLLHFGLAPGVRLLTVV